MGCLTGVWRCRHWGGVNSPCGWYRVRGQLPSTGGQEHTHTHVISQQQASLECKKANESVGCLRWTPWWLPLVVLGSLFETCFCKVIIVEALLSDKLFYLVRLTSWKHWPIRLNSGGPSLVRARKYSDSICACLGATCLVRPRWPCCVPSIWHFQKNMRVWLVRLVTFKTYIDILWFFFKGNFESIGLLQVLADNLSGTPLVLREVLYLQDWELLLDLTLSKSKLDITRVYLYAQSSVSQKKVSQLHVSTWFALIQSIVMQFASI